MDDAMIQTEMTLMTLFAAIEILATGTEVPEDRLRSAWICLQPIRETAVPERLRPRYQELLQNLTTLLQAASEPRSLPLSRIDYIEITTILCTLYRQLQWP